MKKNALAVAAALVLGAGAAAAVEVSPGGKGEALLVPAFMTGGGWVTDLKVINNSSALSTVAKVVFRAPGRSQEVLDFFIFLSPGDVWTGRAAAYTDPTSPPGFSVGVTSNDPSSLLAPRIVGTNCLSQTAVATSFVPTQVKFSQPYTAGYVEIQQAHVLTRAAISARNLGANGATLTPATGPIPKDQILRAFSLDCTNGVAPANANILSGTVALSNPTNGNQIAVNMLALANVGTATFPVVGLDSSAFKGIGTVATKAQIEDALWARNFNIPYVNTTNQATFALVNFPTKATYLGVQRTSDPATRLLTDTDLLTQYTGVAGSFNPRINDIVNDNGSPVAVRYDVRNNEEVLLSSVGCVVSPCPLTPTASLPLELNIISIVPGGSSANSSSTSVFTEAQNEGWVNINPVNVTSVNASRPNYNNLTQGGAPAVATYIQWDGTKPNAFQGYWLYGGKTTLGIGE